MNPTYLDTKIEGHWTASVLLIIAISVYCFYEREESVNK